MSESSSSSLSSESSSSSSSIHRARRVLLHRPLLVITSICERFPARSHFLIAERQPACCWSGRTLQISSPVLVQAEVQLGIKSMHPIPCT